MQPTRTETIVQHTPSPWRVVPPPVSDNGNPWRVAGGDHTIAIVPNRPREADARLIAAAPDLLAEAKAVIGWINGAVGNDTLLDLTTQLLKLQMAIAKAEGRES